MNNVKVNPNVLKNEGITLEGNCLLQHYINELQLDNIQEFQEIYIVKLKIGSLFTKTTDLLEDFYQDKIINLKKGRAIVIFDNSAEGFNDSINFPITNMLEYTHKKHNLPPYSIIYTSSNILHKSNVKPIISTFAFPTFEMGIFEAERNNSPKLNIYSLLSQSVKNTCINYRGYFYSSLSRVNRPYRSIAQYRFSTSDIKNRGLISHDKFESGNELKHCYILLPKFSINGEHFTKWSHKLPFVVDKTDFSVNWAHENNQHIHKSTLFQIVNETLYQPNTIFYSEKTWRPILYMQPFLIWGSPGMNKHLSNLGYQLYTPWFNLSWDDEIDPAKRFKGLFESVRNACYTLENLSYKEQIKWQYKRADILAYNYYNLSRKRPIQIKENLKDFLYKIDERRKVYAKDISRRS